MTETAETKKRNRRSVAQLLADYQSQLESFDAQVGRRRARLVARIEQLSTRHALIAMGHEALNGRTPEDVQAEIDAAIEELRMKRKAVRKIAKIA